MSDAFVVGEDFLSEHFFSSDAKNESFLKLVLDRRKAWEESEVDTSRIRFTANRGQLAVDLANLYADDGLDAGAVSDLYGRIRTMLGYGSGEYSVEHDGPIHRYNTPGVESAAPLAIVDARPAQSVDEIFSRDEGQHFPLLTELERDEKTTETALTKAVSTLFQEEDGPEFALILAGRWLLVTEQARWAEGRYLAVDLQTVADRNDTKRGGEIDRALTILEAPSLAPDADGQVWWTSTLEQSVKHTVGVSKDLREGVRRSIEIIANEVVARRKAQGLDPLPASQAQPLARQSLRFLYRILFLLYAEASPELGVLPVGATEYDAGYSLDRLRELTLVEISTPAAREGTHFYESLDVLFRLVDRGHAPGLSADEQSDGLEFQPLRADLFKPESIALISEVQLGNEAMQQVLQRLLLSKETKGKSRGFISYVELGINQLGAVYEGLMSYTGFFAETDLYEVAKDGNTEKGSWVVPVDRAEGIEEKDFVTVEDEITGEPKPLIHHTGQFVFRLSGRERQQSASYYTPEVLTKFVVSQALEELLDQDDQVTPAQDILSMTVCEPALGSGAFAIEAVRQLAEQYLKRRQQELGEEIPPEDYPIELQRAKAYIALHNVYGVDLNATAVEFAEITLWLDTMSKGLHAPWFGLHLRRGNSLIGARRSVYTRGDVNSKAWLKQPPTAIPLTDLAERIANDTLDATDAAERIHHFLLPAEGWGSTAESKEAKNLVPDRVDAVKQWRKQFRVKPTTKQVKQLVELSYQVEELWTMALRRLMVAEQQTRRAIPVWGADVEQPDAVVTREQIEESLADPNGAYQRLRRVMDAWCALWFWPLTGDEVQAPGWEDWLDALTKILGTDSKARKLSQLGAATLASENIWEALADNESFTIQASNAQPIRTILDEHPWLEVCERVAEEQGFFHWQLDFAAVFACGGFDLQVGNPPWVRPIQDVDALLAEVDPWWQLKNKVGVSTLESRRDKTLQMPGVPELVADGITPIAAMSQFLSSTVNFPLLHDSVTDLYRCFIVNAWENQGTEGISALVHWDSHFTDSGANTFRAENYSRLARHWSFRNHLRLFSEIKDHQAYAVSVWRPSGQVSFLNATNLFHPSTVQGSFHHTGESQLPAYRIDGEWDVRPHSERITTVTMRTLAAWRRSVDPEADSDLTTRMPYVSTRSSAKSLEAVANTSRIKELGLKFYPGMSAAQLASEFGLEREWGQSQSWESCVLEGSHLDVLSPFASLPNPTMLHQQDWQETDYMALPHQWLPITSFKRSSGSNEPLECSPAAQQEAHRVAWRVMTAANTGERTLRPALLPPGPLQLDTVYSASSENLSELVRATGIFGSLIADFTVRALPKSTIRKEVIERLPWPHRIPALDSALNLRVLRLNCITQQYSDLWENCWETPYGTDSWTNNRLNFEPLAVPTARWSASVPLRTALERRQAQIEIDALVALMLGIDADSLVAIYRGQFHVLFDTYDRNRSLYDANGHLVPTAVRQAWNKKGDAITDEDRTHTNPAGNTYVYELPFAYYDREHDMRTAYAKFERRLKPLSREGSTSDPPSTVGGIAQSPHLPVPMEGLDDDEVS